MGFNKDVIRRRRDELAALGVRIRWAGRRPRLWRSVIDQLQDAEEYTRDNDRLTLQFCVNYGGRAEIVDATRAIARAVAAGDLNPAKIDERTIADHLDEPGPARRRPVHPHLGRAAHLELPALAVGLRRTGVPRHAVAGLRPARPVGGLPGLRAAGPALRRRRPARGARRHGTEPAAAAAPGQRAERPCPLHACRWADGASSGRSVPSRWDLLTAVDGLHVRAAPRQLFVALALRPARRDHRPGDRLSFYVLVELRAPFAADH